MQTSQCTAQAVAKTYSVPLALMVCPFGALNPKPQDKDFEKVYANGECSVAVFGRELSLSTREVLLVACGRYAAGEGNATGSSIVVSMSLESLCVDFGITNHRNNYEPFERAARELRACEIRVSDGEVHIPGFVEDVLLSEDTLHISFNLEADILFKTNTRLGTLDMSRYNKLKSTYARTLWLHHQSRKVEMLNEAEVAAALSIDLSEYTGQRRRNWRRNVNKGYQQIESCGLMFCYRHFSMFCETGMRYFYSIRFQKPKGV